MRRDDEDPFDEFFDEIERMMRDAIGDDGTAGAGGFGAETHVDVYETDDGVRLVADLPGVEKDDLSLQCDGETLTIRAAGDRHEYEERIRLPATVDERSASASFNNGILEVTFEKTEGSAAIDVE